MTKPRDMQVNEIFDEIQKIETTMERVNVLRSKYSDHTPLTYILKWNFDDALVSVLPEGSAPIEKEDMDGPSPASLWGYLKLFPRFVDSTQARSTPALKRENLFLEMLQSLDTEEAEMVCLAKDKKLTERWDRLTIDVVQQAFPDLISKPTEVAKPLTPEEKALEMKTYAESLKKQAKELNIEAKKLLTDAEKLVASE